ncbi:ACP S-malonyltransferase [Liberiplasma polymorphum]|uniref:ACP S-malonyltransferase n=1 Tax=Liberiplasma polymorphum TaxID=3374570 RepID=UPI0037718FAC
MKLAFIYSGQGAQYLGMGESLYKNYEVFKNHLDEASNILGEDLKDIMFNQEEKLNQTIYAQPAIFTLSVGITKLLNEQGILSEGSCGLSLGEYGAMFDQGVFSFEDGLRTIIHRAYFMNEATKKIKSKMVALLGDLDQVKALVEKFDDIYIANYNLPSQYVVGGPKASLEVLVEQASDFGIKRAIMLETSGAFHTPYMEEAANGFNDYIKYVKLNEPNKAFYINTTGKKYEQNLAKQMVDQITQPVLFYPMIEMMIKDGFDTFIELGPKATLKAMVKKINRNVSVFNIEDHDSLQSTLASLKEMD